MHAKDEQVSMEAKPQPATATALFRVHVSRPVRSRR